MGAFALLQHGFASILGDPIILLYLVIGVAVGLVFGAIPGLTAALGVSLALPFTFILSPHQGLSVLIGIYVGGISGALIASILLNIPGSSATIVTCFDGYPMAKQGKAQKALSVAIFASLIGGLVSALALIFLSPIIVRVALLFGPWEYFAMGIMGLSVVVSLCSKDMINGFMAAIIGALIAMVGIDPVSAAQRFTFGQWQLSAGFALLPTLMGLFAFSEILVQLHSLKDKGEGFKVEKLSMKMPLHLLKEFPKDFAIGTFVGSFVGVLPGVGQSTASLLAYNQARFASKNPEKFGTGCEEGLISSETANNACCGGSLVPTMTLGIPGDLVTAILLGGLIVHGLQPGPLLFANSPDVVGVVFITYFLSNVIMYVMLLGLIGVFAKMIEVPKQCLYPILLLMCVVGTFAVNSRLFDSYVLLGIGIVGYCLVRDDFSLPPIVLGYVLGPIIETNFRTAVITTRGSVLPLFSRPIAMGMLLFATFMVCWPFVHKAIKGRKAKSTE